MPCPIFQTKSFTDRKRKTLFGIFNVCFINDTAIILWQLFLCQGWQLGEDQAELLSSAKEQAINQLVRCALLASLYTLLPSLLWASDLSPPGLAHSHPHALCFSCVLCCPYYLPCCIPTYSSSSGFKWPLQNLHHGHRIPLQRAAPSPAVYPPWPVIWELTILYFSSPLAYRSLKGRVLIHFWILKESSIVLGISLGFQFHFPGNVVLVLQGRAKCSFYVPNRHLLKYSTNWL